MTGHRALLSDDGVQFVCDVAPGDGPCRVDCTNTSHCGIHETVGIGDLDDEQLEEYGDCVIVPTKWCNLVLWLYEDPTGYCTNEAYLYEAYRAGAREFTVTEVWWDEERYLWTASSARNIN